MKNIKKLSLLLGVATLVLIGGFASSVSMARADAVNTATNINVTPSTYQYTTFKGVPVYRLHITNSGTVPDTLVSLTMDPYTGDTADDTLITLHFYDDVNDNGIVDQGDINLGGSAAFASDNTKQTFTFTSPLTVPVGVTSILITADGAVVGNTGIFHLQISLGTDILMGTTAINNTNNFPLINPSPLTVSDTAPSLAITDGDNDPAPKHVSENATGVVVKQLKITAAATSDSVVSLAITPAGSANDTDISSTKFYIDNGITPGVINGSDILLEKTPTTYTGNDTKTVFTFTSPVQIPGSSSVNILYTYDLGAGIVGGNTLTAQLAATTDAVTGSGIVVSSNSSGVSSPITVDAVTNTVTFNANGGTGTMIAESENTSTALTANTFTYTGYNFNGWNTAAGGTGTHYADGATYDFSADMTLYAQWTPVIHTVTFNANGGTGTMIAETENTSTPLSANAFTYTGYNFNGWNTAAGGTGTHYADGATYPFTADATLYAQWTPITHTVTYDVTYDGNTSDSGYVPVDSANPYNDDATVTVLGNVSSTPLGKTGYTFNDWNTEANNTGTSYAAGGTFPITGNITLFAQWTANPVIATVSSTIANGAVNPIVVVTLTGDAFTAVGFADQVENWTIDYGTTGLVLENTSSSFPIVRNSSSSETFNFTGTAAAGTVTLRAGTNTLESGDTSNLLSITVSSSSDVGLTSVSGQTITSTGGLGTTASTTIASIGVANGVTAVTTADVISAPGSTATLYTDGTFATSTASVALTAGTSVPVYIGVVAADGTTTLYYDVSVTEAAIPTPTVSYSSGGGGGGGGGGGYSVPPYTVTINSGATQTASPSVTLSLTAVAGMNLMWISNSAIFATSTGTGWIPFQQIYPWTLAVTSGTATVYAEFGNTSTSTLAGIAEGSIMVDSGGLEQLLNLLIAELQAVLRQALSAITQNLTVGTTGANVSTLQEFLISQAKGSAASALGAAGATGYFGQLTKAALTEYQKSVGVTSEPGYFGPITRAYLKSIEF
jgi:uncharacterized repeat protein (TIGR02543 family)